MRYSVELFALVFIMLAVGAHSAYLAFPRQGRSQKNDVSSSCCQTGLKLEWAAGKQGLNFSYETCDRDLPCCEGLEEIVRRKPNGMYYSMCIPSSADSYEYIRRK